MNIKLIFQGSDVASAFAFAQCKRIVIEKNLMLWKFKLLLLVFFLKYDISMHFMVATKVFVMWFLDPARTKTT